MFSFGLVICECFFICTVEAKYKKVLDFVFNREMEREGRTLCVNEIETFEETTKEQLIFNSL